MALDGIGEKLKSLFKSKEDPRFKGQGRRLGSSAEGPATGSRSSQPQIRGSPTSGDDRGVENATRPPLLDTSAVSMGPILPLQPPPQPLGAGGRSSTGLLLSRSHRTEEVVLDAAVMANTPTGREAQLVGTHKLPASPSSVTGTASMPCSPMAPSQSSGIPPMSPSQPATPCSPATQAAATTIGGGGSARRSGGPLRVELPSHSGGGALHGPSLLNPNHPSYQPQQVQQQQQQGTSQEPHQRTGSGNQRALQSRATSNLSSIVSTISTPTAAEKRIGGGFRCRAPPTDGAMADYGVAPATSQAYELQRCLALVLSSRPALPPGKHTGPPPPSRGSSAPPPAAATSAAAAAPSADTSNPAASTPFTTASPSALGCSDSAPSPSAAKPTGATAERGIGAGDAGALEVEAGPRTSPPEAASPPAAEGAAGVRGMLASTPPGPDGGVAGPQECCDALLRVLGNVLTKPGESKYRQIRLSNPRVQETIVGVPGAVEFLEAAGFKMQFHPDDGSENANQGFLVLPDEVAPTALAEAYRILSAAMAAHGFTTASATAQHPRPAAAAAMEGRNATGQAASGASSSSQMLQQQRPSPSQSSPVAAVESEAIDRCTQVILPAAPDAEVPDWFFERTGAEIRTQWQSMVRSRQEAEQFMTRTIREVRRQQLQAQQAAEEAAARGGLPADVATVRVRFPEGVCLQGLFGALEPVSRIFEWVSATLRSPALTFELIKPDRRPLVVTGPAAGGGRALPVRPGGGGEAGANVPLTVRSADLMPSVLLNLRPMGPEAAALTAANVPLLSDELLQTTRPQ